MNFQKLIDLTDGQEDNKVTLDAIWRNISFTGANLWILACAIVIASVGLNVNSTAVIIGAMLISPLMGPIVGAGYAIGTYDLDLLKKSGINLLIATVVSLIFSTAYFFISPFKSAQSELLSRIAPDIYDVLIAFFGGLVGIISFTRREKGNPIPGVAIATALMPPLCTAGYGLATKNMAYLFGALYLYGINCVFICIATYIIVKYLDHPAKAIEQRHKRILNFSVWGVVIVMLLPSIYFGYTSLQKDKFNHSADRFIKNEFTTKGDAMIYKREEYSSRPRVIEVGFLLRHFSHAEINALAAKLPGYGLPNTILIIRQDTANNFQALKDSVLQKIKFEKYSIERNDSLIGSLETQVYKNKYDDRQILLEAKAIFPAISSLSISDQDLYAGSDSVTKKTVLIYGAAQALNKADEERFEAWIKQRLNMKVDIYKQP